MVFSRIYIYSPVLQSVKDEWWSSGQCPCYRSDYPVFESRPWAVWGAADRTVNKVTLSPGWLYVREKNVIQSGVHSSVLYIEHKLSSFHFLVFFFNVSVNIKGIVSRGSVDRTVNNVQQHPKSRLAVGERKGYTILAPKSSRSKCCCCCCCCVLSDVAVNIELWCLWKWTSWVP